VRAILDDIELSFELVGDGPLVVFVAGTGYPGCTWPPSVISRLAENFTVVTFDHRGTGETPSGDKPFSTRLFAADAAALVASLGRGPANVIGHSMGGRVAQWMALDAPELVRTLVLAATGPGRHGAGANGVEVPAHVRDGIETLGYEKYISAHQRATFFTEAFAEEHPDVTTWLDTAFWSGRPTLDNYLRHVVARQQHDTVDLLPRIAHPTLVLVGELDDFHGGTGSHVEQSRYLAEHIPGADLVTIPGAKHGYFWEKPVESTQIISSWLASHS
jgi:pimeloyl-ACP methyl ester carboxylesterase